MKRFFVISPEHTYIIFLGEVEAEAFTFPKGVDVEIICANERWYSWAEQITWPYKLAGAKLDLLFVPQFNVPLIVPCPFVVTIHDVTQLYVPGRLQRRSLIHKLAFRLAFWHAVRSAKRVIAVSKYTKEEIVKNFGISKDKIQVIYEGRGLVGLFDEKLPEIGPYLLAVGVWRPHKNLVGLIEAFSYAIKNNPEISSTKLVLVGEEDPRYPEVREAIARLKLDDSVVTTGSVSDGVLDAYYRGASALILPSFFEGFGFSGVEALSRGIPVAASNAAAIPEILDKAALYFNPEDKHEMADAIMDILTDKNIRAETLSKAPDILERYSWDRAAEETISIIEAT